MQIPYCNAFTAVHAPLCTTAELRHVCWAFRGSRGTRQTPPCTLQPLIRAVCTQGVDEAVKDYEIRRHALFFTDAGVRSLYRQNVRQALLRRNSVNGRVYRDDPTIMAWGLLNEPRCEAWKVGDTGPTPHSVMWVQLECAHGCWRSLEPHRTGDGRLHVQRLAIMAWGCST